MIAVSARALSPHDYAAFGVWWTVATLLATTSASSRPTSRLVITGTPVGRTRPDAGLLTDASWSRGRCSGGDRGRGPLADLLFEGHVSASGMLTVFVAPGGGAGGPARRRDRQRKFGALPGQLGRRVLRITLVAGLTALDRASVFSFCVGAVSRPRAVWSSAGRSCPGWAARPGCAGRPDRPSFTCSSARSAPCSPTPARCPGWRPSASRPVHPGRVRGAVTISRIPTLFVAALFGPLLS